MIMFFESSFAEFLGDNVVGVGFSIFKKFDDT